MPVKEKERRISCNTELTLLLSKCLGFIFSFQLLTFIRSMQNSLLGVVSFCFPLKLATKANVLTNQRSLLDSNSNISLLFWQKSTMTFWENTSFYNTWMEILLGISKHISNQDLFWANKTLLEEGLKLNIWGENSFKVLSIAIIWLHHTAFGHVFIEKLLSAGSLWRPLPVHGKEEKNKGH